MKNAASKPGPNESTNTTTTMPKIGSRMFRARIKIKVIFSLILLFFKEMYELITGKRKWN